MSAKQLQQLADKYGIETPELLAIALIAITPSDENCPLDDAGAKAAAEWLQKFKAFDEDAYRIFCVVARIAGEPAYFLGVVNAMYAKLSPALKKQLGQFVASSEDFAVAASGKDMSDMFKLITAVSAMLNGLKVEPIALEAVPATFFPAWLLKAINNKGDVLLVPEELYKKACEDLPSDDEKDNFWSI